MSKICYTIGEVAELLGESTSLVRFWSDNFTDFIHPRRNNKGNRLFSPEDVEMFKKIHFLVKERNLTLEGARKLLGSNAEVSDQRFEVIDKLKEIRSLLETVKDEI
ncbi:MAG: MerR family transcriptional regulator [Bacteroidales bacterium]|nr:MerR family transcriptional regulator [Bacteroidales bacterium]